LFPLLMAILFPRTVYGPAEAEDDEEQAAQTDSSFLLPHGTHPQTSNGLSPVPGLLNEQTKYGTFRPTARPNLRQSAPTTRAPTPTPSTGPDTKVHSLTNCAFQRIYLSYSHPATSQMCLWIPPGRKYGSVSVV
jgi:hypothetical protein